MGQVLSAAVRQNTDLAQARVNIAAADAAAFASAGVDDWVLSASLGLFLSRDQTVGGDIIGTNKVDNYNLDVGLSRSLPTGGTLSINFGGDRNTRVFGQAGVEALSYANSLTATVMQPLLRGRGADIARASIRRARLAGDIERMRREATARDVLRRVINAYWDVALAWRVLEIRKNGLALAKERRRITNASIEAGTVAPTEALAVEQVIATREEEILAAELAITERSLDLRRIANLEVGPNDVDVLTDVPVTAQGRDFDMSRIMTEAMATSPEIAILERQGADAKIAVRLAENNVLPRLDATVTVGPRGTNDTPPGALENLARWRGWSVFANLSYEQTLSNRAASGSAKQARTTEQSVRVGILDAKRQVASASARVAKQAEMARRRMTISERTIALAERNVEAEQGRFTLGRATNFDILQRQDELAQARLRYARAATDFIKSEVTIDTITGRLLDRYGISLAK